MLQVDPLCIVAPRAKAVIVREHMRRKGAAAIFGNHSQETGDLLENKGREAEDKLIEDARGGGESEARRRRRG